MMPEIIGAVLFFVLTVFALVFSLIKSARFGPGTFPNRDRFFTGLVIWMITSMLAVFINLPGYSIWFIPIIYPILKVSLIVLFLLGFFMVLTTVNAFPVYMSALRDEIDGRSDRVALLENIRRITAQPYPLTELFTLTLKEISSFLVIKKAAIFLINPSRGEMYLAAQIGLTRDELSRLERFALGQDIISRTAAEQVSFVSGDLAVSDSASRKLILAGRDIKLSAAAIPLVARDHSLGAMLILSNKSYRFETQDRMILKSAAETLAAEVESNRLNRENKKLGSQISANENMLNRILDNIGILAKSKKPKNILNDTCKYIVDQYGVEACRVVELSQSILKTIAKFDSTPLSPEKNESYNIALIEAIRQRRMVILNQESKNQDDSIFVSRSTLLCPFSLNKQGDYALLVESPGDSLSVTESFLQNVELSVNIITIILNMEGLKKADSFNQVAIKSLLNILEIQPGEVTKEIYDKFLSEIKRILPDSSSAIIFVPDNNQGYKALNSINIPSDISGILSFLPGEGPVGKAAASRNVFEFSSASDIKENWNDLEPVNTDFFSRTFGEKGLPDYQINIPLKVIDSIAAVLSVFDHGSFFSAERKEKGLLLLSAQLLSIKLSASQIDNQLFYDLDMGEGQKSGAILNRVNNNLATIIGRTQLLERQSDISGRTRYTAGEILKASEEAASSIQKMQESMGITYTRSGEEADNLSIAIEKYLNKRHVTGNLFMFDNNRALSLERNFIAESHISLSGDELLLFVDTILNKYAVYVDEGDEVLIKTHSNNAYFFLTIVRGKSEYIEHFNPGARDFGAPDVLPTEFAGKEVLKSLTRLNAQISFDRFGRRPTYISIRFPIADTTSEIPDISGNKSASGLKILAVDDQQMILDLLSGIGQSLGMQLTAVKSPAEAIQLIRRHKYDMVMVDLVMGDISGWDVASAVKEQSQDTPVIMMTGWGISLTREQTRRAGIDFTLSKPFKIEHLTNIINKARLKKTSY